MKNMLNVKSGYAMMGVLILILICCAGCSSSTETGQTGISPSTSTPPMTFPVTAAPVQMTSVVATSTETQYLTYTNPTYQLTMSYPADWQVQEIEPVNCWALRDYGKSTCNIVNFFSPNAADGTYHTFSIDVDTPTTSTPENYFNQATGALENSYPGLQVVKTYFQLKISGNNAYELSFRKGNYDNSPPAVEVITITGNNVPYIFTYNSLEDPVFQQMLKSVQITTVSDTTKQR